MTAAALPNFAPNLSPMFKVPQTSVTNPNIFSAALQQQIVAANMMLGDIVAGRQQPFATALQHQMAQIHQQ